MQVKLDCKRQMHTGDMWDASDARPTQSIEAESSARSSRLLSEDRFRWSAASCPGPHGSMPESAWFSHQRARLQGYPWSTVRRAGSAGLHLPAPLVFFFLDATRAFLDVVADSPTTPPI